MIWSIPSFWPLTGGFLVWVVSFQRIPYFVQVSWGIAPPILSSVPIYIIYEILFDLLLNYKLSHICQAFPLSSNLEITQLWFCMTNFGNFSKLNEKITSLVDIKVVKGQSYNKNKALVRIVCFLRGCVLQTRMCPGLLR